MFYDLHLGFAAGNTASALKLDVDASSLATAEPYSAHVYKSTFVGVASQLGLPPAPLLRHSKGL